MNFLDMIKNSVLERFNGSLSPWQILLGLVFSLAAGVFILFIYKKTMGKVAVGRSFMISLLLICTITAVMVLTITSNLALSLGMVGALSIVRFRTAVKDPADTAYLFWAVAAGITAGAGFYLLTVIGCAVAGLICLLSVKYMNKADKPYLLIIRCEKNDALDEAEEILRHERLPYSLSSCIDTGSYVEAIYEMGANEQGRAVVSLINTLPGIRTVSLVDCRKDG
jgi:uncharacterized membrane protein YhiD involved in acid resistance